MSTIKVIDGDEMKGIEGSFKEPCIFNNYLEVNNSLNELEVYEEKTEVLIVGTVTPSGGAFYYCGKYVRYNTLDRLFEYFKNKNKVNNHDFMKKYNKDVKNFRKELKGKKNTDKEVNEAKRFFYDMRIGFIDVAEKVFRLKGKSSDDAILAMTLDYETFKNFFMEKYNNDKTKYDFTIIANSDEAHKKLKEIISHLKENDEDIDFRQYLTNIPENKIEKLPQIDRRLSKEELNKKWKDKLDECLK